MATHRETAFFDGGAIGAIADALPAESNLFIASSLSVRHLEQYGKPNQRAVRVYCNRGASGIDGTVSSAFGVAAASPDPTVLITGDLAFYHDMNGLLAARARARSWCVINTTAGTFKRCRSTISSRIRMFLTPTGWISNRRRGCTVRLRVREDYPRCARRYGGVDGPR